MVVLNEPPLESLFIYSVTYMRSKHFQLAELELVTCNFIISPRTNHWHLDSIKIMSGILAFSLVNPKKIMQSECALEQHSIK